VNEPARAVVWAVVVYTLIIAALTFGKQLLDATHKYAGSLQAIASVLALVGIVLLAYQIRSAASWNRLNAVLQLNEVDRFQEIETTAIDACKRIGVRFPVVLTEPDAVTLRCDQRAYHAVKAVATFLERQAVAYNAGYYDKPLYRKTFGPLLVGYRAYLSAYIDVCRREMNDPDYYRDLVSAAAEIKAAMSQARGRVDLDLV
jgi:hypothetical protein